MKKIIVKINKGTTTVKAEGYQGESCKQATEALEKALGKVVDDSPTSEMYEEQAQNYLDQGE